MRIKKVDITGFKSFLEPTALNFENPVSVIVGPNGCGKSNIVDAIKWVLGEQSSKTLRCDSMSDVIFNGSKTKKPLSMSEVSVIFENVSDNKELLKYLQGNELTIKRRVFRSGESEYFINKTPVRLKDVHDILIDIKLGINSYSIIEQDQLSSLINAKPVERREVLEEACGITKYKKHKKEAEKKILATNTNLERIKDIFNEVAKRKANLAIHAKKASLYKKYQEEYERLEKNLVAIQYKNESKRLENLSMELEELADKETALNTNVTMNSARISELGLSKTDMERGIENKEVEVGSLRVIVSEKENKVSLLDKDLEEFGRRRDENNEFVEKIEKNLLHMEERIKLIEENYTKTCEDMKTLDMENASFKEIYAKKREDSNILKVQLEESERKRIDILENLSLVKNKTAIYDSKILEIEIDNERLVNEKDVVISTMSEANSKINEISEKNASKRKAIQDIEREIDILKGKIKEKDSLISTFNKDNENLKDVFSIKQSKLHVMKEMEESYTGYSEASKFLLKNPDFKFSSVSHIISAPKNLENAITACLHERIDSIITDNLDIAFDISQVLWDKTLGRVTFLPRAVRVEQIEKKPVSSPKVLGYLVDLIEYEEEYENIINFLFQDIVVVDDIAEARRLWQNYQGSLCFVTLRGELLGKFGSLSCGSFDLNTTDVISRKRVIYEMRDETGRIGVINDLVSMKIREIAGELSKDEEKLNDLEDRIKNQERDIVFLESDLEQQKARIANESDSISYIDVRLDANKKENFKINQERESLQQEILAYKEKEEENNNRFEELSKKIKENEEDLERIHNELTEYRIKSSNYHIRSEESLKNKQEIESQKEALSLDKEKKQNEIKNMFEILNMRESEIENERLILSEKRSKLESELLTLGDLKKQYKAVENEIESLRTSNENDQRELLKISGKKNRRDVVKKEFEIKVQEARRLIEEKYKLKMDEISISENFNINESKKELEKYKGYLKRLGEVNFAALKEYDEVSARYDFLKSQKTDLEKALNSLNLTISKINRICRDLFFEAFNAVSKNFEMVTKELFKNGKGELTLTNPDDLLETGVDIFVQPQGKKVKNINILSGGEKALVLIAYLIAVFYYKPSPFCILDEIDAPLDDANIIKFSGMIDKMSQRTQFIIVTHNKQTMNIGDLLYGVTMEEAGVSKIVEAKFSDIKEKAA